MRFFLFYHFPDHGSLYPNPPRLNVINENSQNYVCEYSVTCDLFFSSLLRKRWFLTFVFHDTPPPKQGLKFLVVSFLDGVSVQQLFVPHRPSICMILEVLLPEDSSADHTPANPRALSGDFVISRDRVLHIWLIVTGQVIKGDKGGNYK